MFFQMLIRLPWPKAILSPNSRPHPMALARAKAQYREWCRLATLAEMKRPHKVPATDLEASLMFVPPNRRKYDYDNLIARMKAGLDGVADALGVDDHRFRLRRPRVAVPGRPPEVLLGLRQAPDDITDVLLWRMANGHSAPKAAVICERCDHAVYEDLVQTASGLLCDDCVCKLADEEATDG